MTFQGLKWPLGASVFAHKSKNVEAFLPPRNDRSTCFFGKVNLDRCGNNIKYLYVTKQQYHVAFIYENIRTIKMNQAEL